MTEFLFVLSTVPTGLAILISYVLVLGNALGTFPLDAHSGDYFSSPYWLGLPRSTGIALTVLQLMAACGYAVWLFWIASAPPLETSLLKTRTVRLFLTHTFLIASVLWPYAVYYFFQDRSMARAIMACVPLWIASIAVILLVGGTFEAAAPPLPTLGILFLALVVVLVDGVGWSAACIKQSVR